MTRLERISAATRAGENPSWADMAFMVEACETLRLALKQVAEAFRDHLTDEAGAKHLHPRELCPCWSVSVPRAQMAIESTEKPEAT